MREQTICLAGGCFWGLERYLSLIPAVTGTEAGYANGLQASVSYEQVKTGRTGHAEAVKVAFDADRMALYDLLLLFFDAIDPESVDRQGGDAGRQYRTGVYYTDEAQRPEIERAFAALSARCSGPVAVEALPLLQYCPAEEYHQKYLVKHPNGYCHIGLDKLMTLTAKLKKLTY